MHLLVSDVLNLDELVVRVTPLLVPLELSQLLDYIRMLLRGNRFVSMRKSQCQEQVEQRHRRYFQTCCDCLMDQWHESLFKKVIVDFNLNVLRFVLCSNCPQFVLFDCV
jgi:hypothetical protein